MFYSLPTALLVTAKSIGKAIIERSTTPSTLSQIYVLQEIQQTDIVVTSEHGTDTIKLMNVEGGSFLSGCYASNRDGTCNANTMPSATTKTVGNYKIGKYEVTQKLWRVVMGSLPSEINEYMVCDNCPVNYVSKDSIEVFLTRLRTMTGLHNFNLPSELQWEYAARGGEGGANHVYMYSGSNNVADVSSSSYDYSEVGGKQPNELGIHDMSGSVYEWTTTSIYESGYKYYVHGGYNSRIVYRQKYSANTERYDLGFRLVLNP